MRGAAENSQTISFKFEDGKPGSVVKSFSTVTPKWEVTPQKKRKPSGDPLLQMMVSQYTKYRRQNREFRPLNLHRTYIMSERKSMLNDRATSYEYEITPRRLA